MSMTLILFFFILSILVFVHEFGHFLAAKKAGILVEEFGFGLPPRIWGKKVGETIYSINALPIGGFVKLYGEDGVTADSLQLTANGKERSAISHKPKAGKAYFEKSILTRLSVLLAGVTMNLILAIICFSVIYYISGIPSKTGKIKIMGITKDSPADLAKLIDNDEIISVDDEPVRQMDKFVDFMKAKAGQKIQLEISRKKDNPCRSKDSQVLGGMAPAEIGFNCRGENLLVFLIPRENPPEGEGPLGVSISDVELKKYPWWQMPFLGVREGFKESLVWGKMVLLGLKETLSFLLIKGKIPRGLAGPIGIFQITGEAAKAGKLAVFEFLGILSVNLAIINVIPFPALDGGRLIFLGYEALFRKKVNQKFEALINNLGVSFLLFLMFLITINDILRLFAK